MENKDFSLNRDGGDLNRDLLLSDDGGAATADHSQTILKNIDIGGAINNKMNREIDSLDDFERLEHDSFPASSTYVKDDTTRFLENLRESSAESPPRVADEMQRVINTGVEPVPNVAAAAATVKVAADQEDPFDPHPVYNIQSVSEHYQQEMDSNLLEMGDSEFAPTRKEEKIDSFMSDLYTVQAPTVPPHTDNAFAPPPQSTGKLDLGDNLFDDFMASSQKIIANEPIDAVEKLNVEKYDEKFEKFSDFPDNDDFVASQTVENTKDSFTNLVDKEPLDGFKPGDNSSSHGGFVETFQDIRNDSPQPPLPKRDYFDMDDVVERKNDVPEMEPVIKSVTPEPPPVDLPSKSGFSSKTIVETKKGIEPSAPVETPLQPKTIEPQPVKPVETKPKPTVIEAEAMFCKMGLDAWFNPQRLDPKVESLIYWRDPKISGAVFGGVLAVLLSLAYFSLISVAAHLSLCVLTGTVSFRIYKNVLQAVQKTADGHPFKEFLDADIALPQDKVKEVSEIAVAHVNAAVAELRRLFLVEDLVDSIKFAVLLWCLTYLGGWFNGMTLIIIAFVALFTLPKVYETNKTQIDANLDIVRTKLADITSKVKAAVPIGKKTEEKKDQ